MRSCRYRCPSTGFPDLVTRLVSQLKRAFPSLGKVKVAEFLARGGLHLQSFDGAEDVARAAEGHAACGCWGRS